MKRLICAMLAALLCLAAVPTLAGNVPETLLSDDGAQVFFGSLVFYHPDKESPSMQVSPVKEIKGDVRLRTLQTYADVATVGGVKPKEDEIYLIAYLDENNPAYIMDVTGYDTDTLKIKGVEGQDMWERMEQFLNDGSFEQAETERKKHVKEGLTKTGETLTLTEFLETNAEKAKTVQITWMGGDWQDFVDKDAFFEIADKIILSEIQDGGTALTNGWFITVEDTDKTRHEIYISAIGEVDKHSAMLSRLPGVSYTVSDADLDALVRLMPQNAQGPLMHAAKKQAVIFGMTAGILLAVIVGFVAGYWRIKKKSRKI